MTEIRTSAGKPSDILQWDALCRLNGNLQQSSLYDPVQAYFRQQPVYFEAWQGTTLIGGSKFYVFTPRKLRFITASLGKYVLQVGESIMTGETQAATVIPVLAAEFSQWLKSQNVVWYTSYGYFDQPGYLIHPELKPVSAETVFANAFVELIPDEEVLWQQIHPHHKHKIHQAEKRGYSVVQTGDIRLFLDLMAVTYEVQSKTGPNPAFIREFFSVMNSAGLARIFMAGKGGTPVSAALITSYGNVAVYAFGGSKRNNDGASHLLHWELMKALAGEGYSKYYLGQVATGPESGDVRFVSGISPFKRRFGTREVVSSRKTFIFKPYSYQVWNMISALAGKR